MQYNTHSNAQIDTHLAAKRYEIVIIYEVLRPRSKLVDAIYRLPINLFEERIQIGVRSRQSNEENRIVNLPRYIPNYF